MISLLPLSQVCYLYDSTLTILLDTTIIPNTSTIPQVLRHGVSLGATVNAGPRYFTYVATITSGTLTSLQYQHQPSFTVALK